MPRDKDLKRLVRARMEKTGEAYTAARAQVLRKSRPKGPKPPAPDAAPPTPPAPPPDYAAMAGMSDESVQAKTGRPWAEWVRVLDAEGADRMPHREIAELVHGKYGAGDWWGQTVTVGYERIKGLRARGQRRDGTYEASKSRTFAVPVDVLFEAWADAAARRRWLKEAGVRVRTATAPKTMRLGWPDGAIVAVNFTPKGASRSAVAVQHTKLPDRETAERLKQYWTERLDTLAEVLAEP